MVLVLNLVECTKIVSVINFNTRLVMREHQVTELIYNLILIAFMCLSPRMLSCY